MVEYRLIYANEKESRYEYFPEDRRDCTAGLIAVDHIGKKIVILQPAERDVEVLFQRVEGAKAKEAGIRYYAYAAQVISRLTKALA